MAVVRTGSLVRGRRAPRSVRPWSANKGLSSRSSIAAIDFLWFIKHLLGSQEALLA
jgi:hypothetical protein